MTYEEIVAGNDLLWSLQRVGGYYECPKEGDGRRRGPLVGYAGKYRDDSGAEHQFVGDVYANFCKMEEHPVVYDHFAQLLAGSLTASISNPDVFCGAPMGGVTLAHELGRICRTRAIYSEKKVLEAAVDGKREKAALEWKRHEPRKHDKVVIVEDVTNNFSTTLELIQLIQKHGAKVVAIVSLLNRSLEWDDHYRTRDGQVFPVISVLRRPIMEYKQGDPAVSHDVLTGNVIWKPKDQWPQLEEAMLRAA